MPINANVVIIDDFEEMRESIYPDEMRKGGHTVVGRAGTMKEAVELAWNLGKLGAQVAMVDGNLSPDSVGGHDGLRVIDTIKIYNPDVKTVSIHHDDSLHTADVPYVEFKTRLGEIVTAL